MSDKEKILDAWRKAPQWDWKKYPILRIGESIETPPYPYTCDNALDVYPSIIEFRYEAGYDGPIKCIRITGKLRETEVEVLLMAL